MLTGVAPLQTAGPDEVSFLDNRKYAAALDATAGRGGDRASRHGRARAADRRRRSSTAEPYVAWARVAALFHPLPPVQPGVHPTAVVGADAAIDPTRRDRPAGGDRRAARRSARAAASAPWR